MSDKLQPTDEATLAPNQLAQMKDAIKSVLKEELAPLYARLGEINNRLTQMETRMPGPVPNTARIDGRFPPVAVAVGDPKHGLFRDAPFRTPGRMCASPYNNVTTLVTSAYPGLRKLSTDEALLTPNPANRSFRGFSSDDEAEAADGGVLGKRRRTDEAVYQVVPVGMESGQDVEGRSGSGGLQGAEKVDGGLVGGSQWGVLRGVEGQGDVGVEDEDEDDKV